MDSARFSARAAVSSVVAVDADVASAAPVVDAATARVAVAVAQEVEEVVLHVDRVRRMLRPHSLSIYSAGLCHFRALLWLPAEVLSHIAADKIRAGFAQVIHTRPITNPFILSASANVWHLLCFHDPC